MVKRKATTSRTTAAKTARRVLSQSNLSSSTPSRISTHVRQAQHAVGENIVFPPSPPRAHPNYTPPTPRRSSIRLSAMVSLSLQTRRADVSTHVSQAPVVALIPAVHTTGLTFTSSFTVDDSATFALRPAFAWPEYSDVSSDNESEAEGDEHDESVRGVGGELEPCEPVEEAGDRSEAQEVSSVSSELTNDKDQEKKSEGTQQEEKERDAEGPEGPNHSDEAPKVEKASATSEADATAPKDTSTPSI